MSVNAAVLLASAKAQQTLCVVEGDKMLPVVKMSEDRPWVVKNGKTAKAIVHRYTLASAEEFLPLFITVRDFSLGTESLSMNNSSPANYHYHVSAVFESVYRLEDVFIVLDMDTKEAGKVIFAYEVGTLESRVARGLKLNFPNNLNFAEGHYQVHMFVKGREVFHSQQPFEYREEMWDRLVARRINAVQRAAPKPLFAPPPDYPALFRQDKAPGRVVVSFRITPRGAVLDPVVVEATAPEFAEAALAAVRVWRFLPKVEESKAVETVVSLPLEFAAPVGSK